MVNRDARDNVRQKLENDPDRDMSLVPGTYNPGNQAGKPVQGGGQRPADEPGGPFLGKGAGSKTPKINPGKTDTPGGKDEQDAPQIRSAERNTVGTVRGTARLRSDMVTDTRCGGSLEPRPFVSRPRSAKS